MAKARRRFDPWDVEDLNYDQDAFYTQSSDDKGKQAYLPRTSIPPALMDAFEEMLAARTFPEYRTMQDVVRDACYHRARYLAERKSEAGFKPDVTHALRRAIVARLRRRHEEQQGLVDDARDLLADARDNPAIQRKVLEQLEDLLESGDVDEPFVAQIEATLERYRTVRRIRR